MLKSRVRNYGRMLERRIVMTHTVTLDTSLELLREIRGIIRAAILSQPKTRFDRSHFAKHGPGSLDFESVYYVLAAVSREGPQARSPHARGGTAGPRHA